MQTRCSENSLKLSMKRFYVLTVIYMQPRWAHCEVSKTYWPQDFGPGHLAHLRTPKPFPSNAASHDVTAWPSKCYDKRCSDDLCWQQESLFYHKTKIVESPKLLGRQNHTPNQRIMQSQDHQPTHPKCTQCHNATTSKVQLGPLGHQFPNNRLASLVYAQSLLLTKRVVSSIAKRLGYQSGILKHRSQQFWLLASRAKQYQAGNVQISMVHQLTLY